jgi:hypothetical protein
MEFCYLELEQSGCNKVVAVLYSDHYTQVWLYLTKSTSLEAGQASQFLTTSANESQVLLEKVT